MGYGLLLTVTPDKILTMSNGLCMTKPHELITPIQAFSIEFIATSVLVWVNCAIW